ncbi:MAG: hypothetical protein E6H79_19710, partial [Betaproteobacteria bacterium]
NRLVQAYSEIMNMQV